MSQAPLREEYLALKAKAAYCEYAWPWRPRYDICAHWSKPAPCQHMPNQSTQQGCRGRRPRQPCFVHSIGMCWYGAWHASMSKCITSWPSRPNIFKICCLDLQGQILVPSIWYALYTKWFLLQSRSRKNISLWNLDQTNRSGMGHLFGSHRVGREHV